MSLQRAIPEIEHAMSRLANEIEIAEMAAAAYRGAQRRYEQLMRHRLANPLTVIYGLADTLCTIEHVDSDDARHMLEQIRAQAQVLINVSIEPCAVRAIEGPLDAWPVAVGGVA